MGWPNSDRTAPTVVETDPENHAKEVAPNAIITVTFSEDMAPETITDEVLQIFRGATTIPGAVLYLGTTAVFTPNSSLDADTEYTATVGAAATDLAGNELADDYQWRFTTEEVVDGTSPQVTTTSPANDATEVGLGASVTVAFSEPMAPETITSAVFQVFDGSNMVPGAVLYLGSTAVFTPSSSLDADTEYTATLGAAATDLAGNELADDYQWRFTTEGVVDGTSPQVTTTSPANDATEVGLGASVTVAFSEPMAPETITPAVFQVFDGPNMVPGAVLYLGTTAVFTPNSSLDADTEYSATLGAAATDLAGNELADDYQWRFTTEEVVDGTSPQVTTTSPANDATEVRLNAPIAVTFSEQMAPETITAEVFRVFEGTTAVPGAVLYVGTTAVFTPNSSLDADTEYSATVGAAATDLAGNELAYDYQWRFTTEEVVDGTPPQVTTTSPANDATEVRLNAPIAVTFSEQMAPETITAEVFQVFDGATAVPGTVLYVGTTAVFTPNSSLDADTEYTGTIATEATDLAGNELTNTYGWGFRTGAPIDLTGPTVVLTHPEDSATAVPVGAEPDATFSEPIDPLTLTAATFTVTGPGTTDVTGAVLYDASSLTATFAPESDLLPATTYSAAITTGTMDVAGNALEENFEWTFTTAEGLTGLAPVDLGILTTFVAVAGAGITNSNSSGTTTLNGDVGLSPTGTCLGDGAPCSATNPVINGTLYANDPAGVAAQAKVDLTAAYVDAASRPAGTTVNDVSGMVLPPGVYTSASTMSIAVNGIVTLDGQGDENATWIFQVGSSLTVNNDAHVLLVNEAKAANVFWAVMASSTLGSNVVFQGSILAGASNSVGTDSVVVGRLLCTTGAITLLSNTITLPSQ